MKEFQFFKLVRVPKENERIVAVAYLLLMEMPANARLQNGLYGEVLNVYTLPGMI